MKKIYMKPEMLVYKIATVNMIAGSGRSLDVDEEETGFGFAQ